jgi:hypothetical protein
MNNADTIPPVEGSVEIPGDFAVFSEEEQREIAERIEAASARGSSPLPSPPPGGRLPSAASFPFSST